MRFLAFAPLLTLVSVVVAHPGASDDVHPENIDELIARNKMIEETKIAARACAPEIAEFEAQRMAKRQVKLERRQQTSTFTAPIPRVTSISNFSCVLHPEVVEGPYYIRNEFIRSDLRETQPGVKLVLDIGVVDSRTCKPIPNSLVELWATNSTGFYGGYPAGSPTHIKTQTWARGGHFTNAAGIVELTTLYPGFYSGRTAHIHTMVHGGNWQSRANGTFVSGSGSVNHIGQFFFEESWNDRVYATAPYNTNRNRRTLNSQDGILRSAGPGAFVQLSYLNNDNNLNNGLFGLITVVVNPSSNYRIQNSNALR